MSFNFPLFLFGLALLLILVIYVRRRREIEGRYFPSVGVNSISFLAFAAIITSIVTVPFTGNTLIDILLSIAGITITGTFIDAILRITGIGPKISERKRRPSNQQ